MEEHQVNDLYEDMERLNALYEELMWPHDVDLEFSADYENNRIIISLKDHTLTVSYTHLTLPTICSV